jgi:serine/threonine protein kinase
MSQPSLHESLATTVTRQISNSCSEIDSDRVERLAREMRRRWQQGERPCVEDLLAGEPDLEECPEEMVELLYEEICIRREFGEETAALDVARRFPQWAAHLQVLSACQELLRPGVADCGHSVEGERLGDFHLLAELGRGVQGPVFVATQPALADRPVVIKLIPRDGQEHLSLARLQHTHIVPLYSVQEMGGDGLLALCMPYFGGTTLAHVLSALQSIPPRERTGKHILEAIRDAQPFSTQAVPVAGPACQFLARVSYEQAICWIGACVSDALHYAADRGLVHLDVKPSNVLLAADGQPMLLDFHLARAPLLAGAAAPERLGGTPTYMAPEQQLALPAVQERGTIPVDVDARADIYSLGVLLYEALGGPLPLSSADPGPTLRRCNPQVTAGLADLLSRCLAADARDRYSDAAALAADLRRHLTGLPLQGVRNRSLIERWRKWRRRRPAALAFIGFIATLVTAAGLVLVYANRQRDQARLALTEGRDFLAEHQPTLAVTAFQRGLALMKPIPLGNDLDRELRDQLDHAERAVVTCELHFLVEGLRSYFGAVDLTPMEARQVEAHCRQFWEKRDLIYQRLQRQDDPGLELQVQADLLDLAILWTDLSVRLAGSDAAMARQEALKVLDEAKRLFGSSCVLEQEWVMHASALGLSKRREAAVAPRTAWEHCALGRVLFRTGDVAGAAAHFQQAVELEPGGLWANYYRGTCAYHQACFHEAVSAFSACVAVAPDRAWCFYNRGLAYLELGSREAALRDFNSALRLEPTLTPALVQQKWLQAEKQKKSARSGDSVTDRRMR